MKRIRTPCGVILAVLLVGAVISSGARALAQGGDGDSSTIRRNEATAAFSMAYGLPGKPGYNYTRPFDYFHFEFKSLGNVDNPFDNVMIRGLLLGKRYEAGDTYRGIWGLYGGYDFHISAHLPRLEHLRLSRHNLSVVALAYDSAPGVGPRGDRLSCPISEISTMSNYFKSLQMTIYFLLNAEV